MGILLKSFRNRGCNESYSGTKDEEKKINSGERV